MTEEYQTIVKRLIIRMVDAMGLWRSEDKNSNQDGEEQPEVRNVPVPTWEEKEMAVIQYMASYKGLLTLAITASEALKRDPERKQYQYVSRSFVQNAIGIVMDYAETRFPEQKETFEKEQAEKRAEAAREKLSRQKEAKDDSDAAGDAGDEAAVDAIPEEDVIPYETGGSKA